MSSISYLEFLFIDSIDKDLDLPSVLVNQINYNHFESRETISIHIIFNFANFKVHLSYFTLSGTSIVLNPVVTLDTRFNLYQPIDIGQIYLANMVVQPCTMPTTDTDIYNDASVMLYQLGSASTVVCITLDTSETKFN